MPADPPRDTVLALWRRDGAAPGSSGSAGTVEVVAPPDDGGPPERRVVPARLVPLADAVDHLVTSSADADITASVRAWAAATRLALGLVARGRLRPGRSPGGSDAWLLGPHDPDDVRRWHDLAGALPPAAHCLAAPGVEQDAVVAPRLLLGRFGDAVADVVARTAASPDLAGHAAFAAVEPVPVGHRDWFDQAAPAGRTTLTLRLVPPDPDDGPFTAELVLQSPDDPSLLLPAGELWAAPDTILDRFADAEETVLLTLRRAATVWSPIDRLLDQAAPDRLELDDLEVVELLGPLTGRLGGAGVHVEWPAELFRPLELRPTLTTASVPSARSGSLNLDALLTWRARVDGEPLSEDEIDTLVTAKRGVVRLRGRWVRADPERLARLGASARISGVRALAAALGAPLDPGDQTDGDQLVPAAGPAGHTVDVEGPLADLAARLRSLGAGSRRVTPPDLDATLRPYQERGAAWMEELAGLGLGGILADDMGLGKTLQVIALHLARRPTGRPTLVVAPATLVANWEREVARFAPTVPVRRYHGPGRHLDDLAPDEIVVTTYGVVRGDAAALGGGDGTGDTAPAWGLCVADEAQTVKNPHSLAARALRSIPADARFALSGTPVENQLSELWAIAQHAVPGLLGSLESFRRELAIPIERDGDEAATERLTTLLRPFLLRRRKTDPGIAPDLPPRTESDHLVGLTAEQATLYRAVLAESLDDIADAAGIARRGLVLRLLTALKQICNHPANHLGQDGPLPGRSAKLDAVTDLVGIIRAEEEHTLIFTQYVAMGRLLVAQLGDEGHRVGFLHGSLGLSRRQELVDTFQGGGLDVLVISLKAGGTGLNLTRASHVIHYDRWWNPAVEDQASDRAWRIGQERPVQIHRMVCEGTVEERIAVLLAEKRQLADRVVGTGETWIGDLDDSGLAALVALAPGAGS